GPGAADPPRPGAVARAAAGVPRRSRARRPTRGRGRPGGVVKIALVCPYDWAKPGGVRAHVASLADHLAADHEVKVFAPSRARAEAAAERRLVVVGRPVG